MPKPRAAAATLPALNLTAFRAAQVVKGSVPRRMVICPPGTSSAGKRGPVIVNAKTFEGLEARQNEMKLGMRLALDAEHCTVPDTPAYLAQGEPRAVLAWCTLTGSVEEGLVFDDIEPTALGLSSWDLYQDVSPALFRDKDGAVLAVHSAALCRHGELDGLTIAAAAAPAPLRAAFAALSVEISPEPNTTTPPMQLSPAALAALTALLAGLDITLPTDDAAALEAALTAFAAKLDALKAAATAKPAAMSADLSPLKAQLDAFTSDIANMKKERETERRTSLVALAASQGKVIPLSDADLQLTPLSVLESIIEKLPAGKVPTKPRVAAEVPGTKPDAFTAEDLEVAARFGHTQDDLVKFGNKTAKPDAK